MRPPDPDNIARLLDALKTGSSIRLGQYVKALQLDLLTAGRRQPVVCSSCGADNSLGAPIIYRERTTIDPPHRFVERHSCPSCVLKERPCIRCKELRPLTDFDIRAANWTFDEECNRCRRANNTRKYAETSPAAPSVRRKLCASCGRTKAATEFYRAKLNADGLEGRCKQCRNAAFLERISKPGPSRDAFQAAQDRYRRRKK